MALVNRWYQILQLLVTHKEITLTELQKQLSMSPQTIRKSIDTLNDELVNIALIVQCNNHFHLEIQQHDQFDVVMTGSLKKRSDFNSSSKRVAYIIKRLIEADDFVLIDDLSEELGVSRGTVVKDIRNMKQQIGSFAVKVRGTPNRGMQIVGNEFDLRLLHIYYVQDYFEETFLTEETKNVLQEMVSTSGMIKNHSSLLQKAVSIVLQRVLTNNLLTDLPDAYTNYVQQHDQLEQLIYHLETTYNVTLSQLEQAFISFPFNMNATKLRDKHLANDEQLMSYFSAMMQKIYGALVVDIDEEQLFGEMKDHLMYMINRLVFRVELQDLFYGEIEKQYPFAYELAKVGAQALGEKLYREMPTVEYSYLAFYFELALRRQPNEKSKKEIAVVCSTGKGTALIIRRQLERVLGPEIQITHFSEEAYEKSDLNKYFAIFTTIPLKNVDEHTPVIQLTNLFNDTWLRKEWKRAEKVRAASIQQLQIKYQLLSMDASYIENLSTMINVLRQEELIDEQFAQRIFEREAQYSTIFESRIAFPHTTNPASTEIILSVGIFPETFQTEEGSVEIIFLLAIPATLTIRKERELLQLYDQLFAVAGNAELRKELCQQRELSSLLTWMKRKGIIA
ncbi:HTH domain-containing protein [Enterococcus saccharolyticus]|uniref:BglG family transcription antiterminator n=1 Tax=Enterococcus TaxID=1350 RepID=UPI001E2B014F|nr:HTH domain-containing protein [Enterococcus saccharolyticus]MCD5001500.1 HTH domain-containing protein [Enterococcus saccharolyticus]